MTKNFFNLQPFGGQQPKEMVLTNTMLPIDSVFDAPLYDGSTKPPTDIEDLYGCNTDSVAYSVGNATLSATKANENVDNIDDAAINNVAAVEGDAVSQSTTNAASEEEAEVLTNEEPITDPSAVDELSPVLDDEIYGQLPELLRPMVEHYGHGDAATRTMLVLAQLAAISGMLPNVRMKKGGRWIYPNMGLVVAGPPASGKAECLRCHLFFTRIDKKLHEEGLEIRNNYDEDGGTIADITRSLRCLRMPGDVTNAMFMDILMANEGRAIIAESEIKALTNMLGNGYGITIEKLLEALEHESIDIARRGDHRLYKISEPKLTMLLTGVQADIPLLMGRSGISSGLFSRMLFYILKPQKKVYRRWSDEEEDELTAEEVLKEQIGDMESIYSQLNSRENALEVKITKALRAQADDWLAPELENGAVTDILGEEYDSVIKRFNTHVARVSMILAVLREFENFGRIDYSLPYINVAKEDFATALAICRLLYRHAQLVFAQNINEQERNRAYLAQLQSLRYIDRLKIDKRKKFLFMLHAYGKAFSKKEFKKIAADFGYSASRQNLDRLFNQLTKGSAPEIVQLPNGLYCLADTVSLYKP